MKWNQEQRQTAQQYLQQQQLYPGPIDGIIGPDSILALSRMKGVPATWDTGRRLIACIQYYCRQEGIDPGPVDGIWGSKTQRAFNQLSQLLLFPSAAPSSVIAPVTQWPLQTPAALNRFYGRAQAVHNPHLVTYAPPYPLRLAWDTSQTVTRMTTHEKVKDSLLRVLHQVSDHYGPEEIDRLRLNRYGGCFNYRKMRNGTTLSTHAWGIALDFDPEHNQLTWGKDKAAFARPEYEAWWSFWEKEGWVSLGRTRNYDWMHVQAARLSA